MTKLKVLVIEDNEQNMYLVSFILEKNGYEVIQARTGIEGVDLAVLHEPDLILLDIQLPVMDGYSVARAIRNRPSLAKTPMIAVTSYAMPGDCDQAMAAGCTGYIEKPIDPENFMSQVEQFVRGNERNNP
ncbi:MAG: response regulator [Leptolinea sp.]|nr:response regulator [Leptolinea sp.]